VSIRALIVDDEPLARRRIRALLERNRTVTILGECGDGASAVEAIRTKKPDLVFLDVQMPELDGFGVIEAVGAERMPAVIFVTAYDEHAVRAFEKHAVDYLVKPFDDERFADAVSHATRQLDGRAAKGAGARLVKALEALEAGREYAERLVVRSDGRLLVVPVDEIDWVSAEDNYVVLHLGKTAHRMRGTMNDTASRLDPRAFLRINRSTIVAIDRIRELQPAFHGEYYVILKDASRLVVSRGYRDRVLERLAGPS
jgi:two-component system LytT family response regulator